MKNIMEESNEFETKINPMTMKFKNKDYEEEYKKYKYERKNLLVVIGIDILFTMYVIGLRTIVVYCKGFFELFSTSVSTNLLLVQTILWNSAVLVEIIIFFIPKLNLLRGFLLTSLPMAGSSIFSLYYCTQIYKTNGPMFTSLVYFNQVTTIITALLYSANWICGALQIIIYNLIACIIFSLMPGNAILDTPFHIINDISETIGIIITIYYIEYLQRKATFLRLEAQKQRNNLREIIDHIPEPFVISRDKKIMYGNLEYLELNNSQILNTSSSDNENFSSSSARQNSELSERDQANISPPQDLNHFARILHNNITQETLERTIESENLIRKEHYRILKNNQVKLHFEISSVKLDLGNEPTYIYLLNNLTLFSKIKKLKEKEKYDRIYFASISHDFRTPLGIIIGNCQLLMENLIDTNQFCFLKRIYNASNMLLLLVKDILDYSQIKSGSLKLNPNKYILEKEILVVIDLFKENFDGKGLYLKLKVDLDVPRYIYNDIERVKQILINLISNSYKFTINGGVIVYVKNSSINHKIIIQIQDSGVGMSPEEVSLLFHEFCKIESHRSLNPNGVGLGLHICKQILKHLGGTISVESKLNEGTIFSFSFSRLLGKSIEEIDKLIFEEDKEELKECNIDQVQFNSKFENEEKKLCTSKKEMIISHLNQKITCKCSKLLIVDDDSGIRMVTQAFASSVMLKSDVSRNGVEAIEKVKEKLKDDCCKYYSLVLIDNHMPIMDGIESSIIIKEILDNYPDSNTQIVLVSGLGEEEKKKINNMNRMPFALMESKPLRKERFEELIVQFLF